MEKMYDLLEEDLQKKGHQPAWFPALIPEKNFKLEGEHIKGFSPQVFWITTAAGKKLKEKLAMRPTSETAMYQLYSIWIRSHKDLPFKMYQRAQVWRYETKMTRPFIRSREFYWIEGHNCFATKEEAENQVQEDIDTTRKLMYKKLCIPFLPLKRPEWDKFPGAVYTIGSDTLMPDGRVIQQPSTHFLGQGFAKVFKIKFKDKDKKEKYVWQTCYGPAVSRIIASVIAIHGDDNGLVLPFIISPLQVIIVPIYSNTNKDKIFQECKEIEKKLKEHRITVKIDDKESSSGEKYYFWEMKGVPIRLEIGEREIKTKKITLFKRDIKEKIQVNEKDIVKEIEKQGQEIDNRLREKADSWFKKCIVHCRNKEELKKAIQDKKISKCEFCNIDKEGEKCAEVIEKQILANVRGVRCDIKEKAHGKCIICGKKANHVVYIAKSY
jgi:prolyl-tRNA synthetase